MSQPAIRPTTTQRVRAFLTSQGANLRPWSGLSETYDELYRLLRRRRDDPALWQPLAELLQGLVDSAVVGRQTGSGLSAPQAELLASWDIQVLIRKLRQALPEAQADTSWSGFTRGLPAAVLGGFLMLGLAASGCTNETDDTSAGGAGGTTTTAMGGGGSGGTASTDGGSGGSGGGELPPWYEGCSLGSASVLYTAISGSSLTEDDKHILCGCFDSLNASWSGGLTELFETGTPDQIAAVLQHLVICCEDMPEALDSSYPDMEQPLLEGMLCSVPVYKGVTFPA